MEKQDAKMPIRNSVKLELRYSLHFVYLLGSVHVFNIVY